MQTLSFTSSWMVRLTFHSFAVSSCSAMGAGQDGGRKQAEFATCFDAHPSSPPTMPPPKDATTVALTNQLVVRPRTQFWFYWLAYANDASRQSSNLQRFTRTPSTKAQTVLPQDLRADHQDRNTSPVYPLMTGETRLSLLVRTRLSESIIARPASKFPLLCHPPC